MTNNPAADEVPPAAVARPPLSAAGRRLFGRVRLSCAISAAGFLLPLAAIIVVQLTQGTTGHDAALASERCRVLIGFGILAVLLGKAFCLGAAAEFGDQKFVQSAFVLDLVALGSALLTTSEEPGTAAVVGTICLMLSPLVFAKYLGQVAEGLGRRKLVDSSQRVVIGCTLVILFSLLTLAWLVLGALGMAIFSVVAEWLYWVVGLIGFITSLLYVALLAAFAATKLEPAPDVAA